MEGTSRMTMQEKEGENSQMRDGDYDSRSGGSDEVADEIDESPVPVAAPGRNKSTKHKKMKYNRHTPVQIQELEALFKICPHPDEKQRLQLGDKLGLDSRQVKFWFQNRRTQLKAQLERHENVHLKQQYEKLKLENIAMREYIHKPLCKDCGGTALLSEITTEERTLKAENAKLKEDLIRATRIAENLLGRPIVNSFTQQTQPGLLVGNNGEPVGLVVGGSSSIGGSGLENGMPMTSSLVGEYETSLYLQVAIASMDELVVLAQNDPPLWTRDSSNGMEMFKHEEYLRKFDPYGGIPSRFKFEATREVGSVIINSLELVNTLMTPKRWVDMFPSMIGKTSIISVLCNGAGGGHDGELLLMEAEFLFPSPYVPLRQVRFLRYCKKHTEGAWAVVDISIDPIRGDNPDPTKRCRRLPSGFCIVQDVANAYSLVTCIEHVEYDEQVIHELYRPVVQSGFSFGAQRWLATIQRQCEYAAFLPTSDIPPLQTSIGITTEGRKSILKLTRRVIDDFCTGICASSVTTWEKLSLPELAPNLQVMTRVNIDQPGVLSGTILSFATSIWLPVLRSDLFDFLRNGQMRGHWDILADDGPMEETVKIAKSVDPSNAVAILCPPSMENKEANMVVVQETWTDKTGSAVMYASVDINAITGVMEGGDPDFVRLVPSGFLITDSFMETIASNGVSIMPRSGQSSYGPASLLTLGFQVLMNTSPTTKLTLDSIETVNELMSRTIQKIKSGMNCN